MRIHSINQTLALDIILIILSFIFFRGCSSNINTTPSSTSTPIANVAPTISYTESPFTFTKNTTITTIAATLTGDTPSSCTSVPTLPAGLSINTTTCAISGTPTGTQVATTYTITATNATGNDTAEINITVNTAGDAPIVSYTGSPFTFIQNSAITTITATIIGNTPSSCTAVPTLPTGLSINATTCVISGTPTGTQATTVHTISATNSFGIGTTTISIAVMPLAPNAPTGVVATGGDNQITISWTTVAGATSYNLYWSTSSGVTIGTGTKVTGVTSPYVNTGRTNGTDYYYIVTAVGPGGESVASNEVSAYSYRKPLKTSQTQCWNASGTVISCSGTGQDGENQAGRAAAFTGPTQHGTYTSDYTTTDNVTGLVWKSCIEGYSGAACLTGTNQSINWTTATNSTCDALNSINSSAGYGGRTDWRLPKIEELETIINYGSNAPILFSVNFPTQAVTAYYWSSSTFVPFPTSAWYVFSATLSGFSTIGDEGKATSYLVRCVSSGPYVPAPTYLDNGDGTVSDKATGLIWQKCSRGQTNDATCSGTATSSTWENALAFCNGLTLASKSWRLPNVNELTSTLDQSTSSPAINSTVFPGTANSFYWSSSTAFDQTSNAIQVYFKYGHISSSNKTSNSNDYTRCVSLGP